jgi:hypothetical protein
VSLAQLVVVWPHFAGKAYIRVGPEVKEASQQQFDQLIAERSTKTYEILKSKGQQLTVHISGQADASPSKRGRTYVALVRDCNAHYVILDEPNESPLLSYPLERTLLSFDQGTNRLRLVLT